MVQTKIVPFLERPTQFVPVTYRNRIPYMELVLLVVHGLLEAVDLQMCQSRMLDSPKTF